ncbi:hypothetical protein M8542_14450 [Amycolatopsis sp. OK19-0408]|uniref:Uncharacterized protein n=1 Tax=Amycolatopsis iheyensis TaxID=2945988 RepID=A0A9X2N818_9PSEU|nr:hypothetical protein [Amycolatopsis iheyensis]MCR6484021.1 hypothetical protein [Amycolatopsis iheyensis]
MPSKIDDETDGAVIMAVRTIDLHKSPRVSCAWQRRLSTVSERIPKPTHLYSLIALTFVLHKPDPATGECACCEAVWPCDIVRQAYRLREGF